MPATNPADPDHDLLVAGARSELRSGAKAAAALAAVLAVAGAVVVTHRPVTLDGHGSRTLPPAHVQYQPYLGRPVF